MGRTRRPVSTFAGLPLELKQALRAGTVVSQVQTPTEASKQRGDNDELGSDPDPELYAATQRPAKRRRIESPVPEASYSHATTTPGIPRDPTVLVPFMSAEHQVPPHLAKYWHQRERLFSRYDEGCLLDEEGWFSVTPERVANQIAERCACNVILDPFCGVGGNAIAFAQTCEQVIAIDNSPTRLALARHNAQIYGVADRIEFILGDFVQFAQSYKTRRSPPIDVVFLSPPWGGISYLSASPSKQASLAALASDESEQQHPDYPLSLLQPLPGKELFALARAITPHVALFLPRNSDLQDISALVADEPDGTNLVEVEEEWMGNKLKALTCYFGGLATGQEQLFS